MNSIDEKLEEILDNKSDEINNVITTDNPSILS